MLFCDSGVILIQEVKENIEIEKQKQKQITEHAV
jgi:hypothetical protein